MQCLMDQLFEAQEEAGQPMGEQALRDELLLLLVAGQETAPSAPKTAVSHACRPLELLCG